ncbi:hypothetical protein H0H93_003529 [Arthromyces matolae]|nr:hypothetical protein H0H93_003529 [Arthromyces matolae]
MATDALRAQDLREAFHLVTADINQHLQEFEVSQEPMVVLRLVARLTDWYNAWSPPQELGVTLTSAYTLNFQTHLFSSLPPSFSSAFKVLIQATISRDDPAKFIPQTQNPKLWASFETLGLLDRYEYIVAGVGYDYIETHVQDTCAGSWSKPMLNDLRNWMTGKMMPWMILPYARGATSRMFSVHSGPVSHLFRGYIAEEAKNMLSGVGARFDFHMNKTLCDLRTKEIFDIIIDFPDSMGALTDLKDCMSRVDQRSALVQSLRRANQKRLLHPGADTKLILSQYVATIKCLRIIDPQGVLLFKVADPIRRYLRERPDTIRSIVANLVGDDDGGDSLVDENEPIQPLQQNDVEDYSDPNWEPEPIDSGPDFRTNKPSDIISTLVSIYDSKDLFVKELQVLLAQRLLAITGDETEKVERERRNIEILKIRFGEAALQVCEVMLKDMTDSKRIDGQVQSRQAVGFILQEHYAHEYTVYKPDKKLRWLPHLGKVHLELQLNDRVVEADVPPLEAAFIELFSDKTIWTVDELIVGVGTVDRSSALNALLAWVDRGVLKEDTEGTFRLLEVAEEASTGPSSLGRGAVSAPELPPVMSVQQQQAEQMRVYWKVTIEPSSSIMQPLFTDSPNARSKSITTVELDTNGVLNRHATKNTAYQVGVTEDKGSRRTMEDSHSFVVDFDAVRGQGFFAIFDGHAGKHAAEWCGNNFHEHLLLSLHNSPQLPIPDVLNETFHNVDEALSRMCEESEGKIHSGCTVVTAFLRVEDADGRQSFVTPFPPSPVTDSPTSGHANDPESAHSSGAESTGSINVVDHAKVKKKKSSGSSRIKKALRTLTGTISSSISAPTTPRSVSPAASRKDFEIYTPVTLPPPQSRRVLYTANAGDARAVLCRGGRAVRLSYDHKGSDKQEAKRITDAGGFVMSGRVNGVLAVTRSLGDSSMKEFVVGSPYTTETELCDEDEFLILACDGLWDVINDQTAVELIREIPDAQAASGKLLKYALSHHTTDNVTVMVVRFKHVTPKTA